MNSIIIKYIGRGVVAATLLCSSSSLFADASSDRLATYKANKLIPQEVKLKVGGNAENDITFISSTQSWASGSVARANVLKNIFSEMTLEEIQNFSWYSEDAQDMAEFLAAIQTGKITSDLPELTPEKARELKMKGFRELYGTSGPAIPFSFDGTEDFSGISMSWRDFSMLSGVTGAQIAQLSRMDGCRGLENVKWSGNEDISGVRMENMTIRSELPPSVAATGTYSMCTLQVAFTGEEDFSKSSFFRCDLSKSTGLTGYQFCQAGDWEECSLPAITFTGSENFSGTEIAGLDFSKASGLKAEQLIQAKPRDWGYPWRDINLNKSQYEAMKDELTASLPEGMGCDIYVDGERTTIMSPCD